MRSDRYLANICMEIYREIYKQAEPSADFDKLIETGEAHKPDWFIGYYLPIAKQIEIVDDFCRKYKCNRYEKKKISETIFLGSSPSGYRDVVRF